MAHHPKLRGLPARSPTVSRRRDPVSLLTPAVALARARWARLLLPPLEAERGVDDRVGEIVGEHGAPRPARVAGARHGGAAPEKPQDAEQQVRSEQRAGLIVDVDDAVADVPEVALLLDADGGGGGSGGGGGGGGGGERHSQR